MTKAWSLRATSRFSRSVSCSGSSQKTQSSISAFLSSRLIHSIRHGANTCSILMLSRGSGKGFQFEHPHQSVRYTKIGVIVDYNCVLKERESLVNSSEHSVTFFSM